MTRTRRALLAAVAASSLTAANLEAVVPHKSPLAEKSFRHANIRIPSEYVSLQQVPAESRERVGTDIASLGLGADSALYSARAGRLASLIVSEPLVPGTGVGNSLKWVNFGGRPVDEGAMKDAVWNAVTGYLQHHAEVLRVDVSELSAPRIAIFENGNIIQVFSQRRFNGIPVRDSSVTAIINHGNLVLLGLQNWGDAASLAATAQNSAEAAQLTVSQHVQPFFINNYSKDAHLEYIPMVSGSGYEFRLVWAIRATVQDDLGTWEGLVDAVSGELIAFEDRNEYAARKVMGGVYPVSNDQIPPDGVEQAGFPMPFANVTTPTGVITTNSGGTIGCVTGNVSTALVGRYAQVNDTCGPINESSAAADIDLGFGPTPTATDCAVPVGHAGGDTKSSRSAFYELTRINELARGHLPTNNWLQTSLLANVNILQTCNANWNGASVQFFRDSGSACRNTGEIAAIFDHEWGHGMDNNGVNPNIANPGEGIADVYSILRLNDSCMGRGFFKAQQCGGYGDPCTNCTGVRDTDWARRVSGVPHGIPFIDGACGSGPAPCGGGVHCEGAVVGESGWDLAHRDMRGFNGNPINLDHHTAQELATRLFYIGSGPVVQWFECTNPNGGCLATGGYMNILAVDDDNGNLTDGTPHMTAIHAAFNRHNIACATPAVVNSGCVGGPTAAPVVTAVPQDQGVALSWTAVPNATRYYVYRTEGNGANFGKAKIAEVTGTTYVDTTLQNGRVYFFSVLPVGANASCMGLMSTPVTVTPVAGPNLGIRPGHTVTVVGGDGDIFLDNCETANVGFTVENTGTGPLTNVRLVAVAFLTHPTSLLQTTLPAPIAASLADCASANGAFSFILNGATPSQTTQIRIDVTADQIFPQVRSQVISIGPVETDVTPVATRTYNFDTDLQGWTVTSGIFTRVAPGANGTPFHVSSSEALAFQCDVIRSPAIRLTGTSTLSLQNNFDIEPTSGGMTYDRANVGVVDTALATRTVVSPSGGTLYSLPNAPTPTFAECQLGGQAGWHAQSPGYPAFAPSSWTSAALNPGGVFSGRLANLEIRYGTDFGDHREGFDFDELVLTNFEELVPDTLPNACVAQAVAPVALAVDTAGNSVMEPNETANMAPTWRNTGFAAITLTGATTNFTGPMPAVYTNPDNTADYGTIGVAAQASCSTTGNCYTVLATATPRPVTHWDSTILETVSPTAATKSWRLHIGASFTDVPTTNPFYRFVETILHKNVTGGCGATTYCPTNSTTREQMAVFVLVSKEPPAYVPADCAGTPMFADVPVTSPFCKWIEELARRGVVAGCGGGNYCPSAPVTREQMAVFVLRTLDGTLNPPACVPPNLFADVPETSAFCRWIEELANRGVVTGCGGGNYCPTDPVTREQMGVFLTVTFGLTLYGL